MKLHGQSNRYSFLYIYSNTSHVLVVKCDFMLCFYRYVLLLISYKLNEAQEEEERDLKGKLHIYVPVISYFVMRSKFNTEGV